MLPPIDLSDLAHSHVFPNECEDTARYTAAQVCAVKSRRWVNWYIADWVYAQPTVILICAFLAVFAIVHRYWLLKAHKSPSRSPALLRTVALFRWLSIKQVVIPGWSSVSVGNCLILGGLGLFFLVMTVAPQPYYWPEIGWAHSPPLGTRTGWMALALLPFLIVLASKRNPIALLTGLSHERLQLFHRWFAFFMLLLGLIHTFAFVRYNAAAGTSKMMWMSSSAYWTGVAMLVPQIWLTFMSLAPIRNKYYEFFKLTHRMTAIIFTVFFFLHCGWTLTSWDYFWALIAVYGCALITRVVLIIRNKFVLRNRHAHLRVVGDSMLEIRIPSSGLQWHAGQHFFFRFTGLNFYDSIQSHPFTPCTVPTDGSSDLMAMAKIRRGLILELANHSFWRDGLNADVWVDGPYGSPLTVARSYDRVLLLGGGSGLSVIASAASEFRSQAPHAVVSVVASCKTASQLDAYLSMMPTNALQDGKLSLYVTGGRSEESISLAHLDKVGDVEKQSPAASAAGGCCSSKITDPVAQSHEIGESASSQEGSGSCSKKKDDGPVNEKQARLSASRSGRPDLKQIIREEANRDPSARLAIIASGPVEFMRDVQQEVAALQMEIFRGARRGGDLYLRSEAFHW